MTDLKPDDFPAFFHALWGYSPFPWQQQLLLRLVRKDDAEDIWPDVLDLPTGSGKTATLDIAVFHLALEAAKGTDRRAPLRIAFVVDRRLIVDDVYGRAVTLQNKLREAIDHPSVVGKVARALQSLAGSDQPPLIARSLRGGAPLESDWARTPVQPTILCSTVDQVGSRLLFRGYGVSDRMKPIHAGLLGSDCLILLDEAHLSEPFRQTLNAVKGLRKPDKAPFTCAVLSATPAEKSKRSFALSADDRANPTLKDRLEASKPARLIDIMAKQGVEPEARRVDEVAIQTKALLDGLRDEMKSAHPAIGVVVNRVARARAVFERLKSDLKVKHDESDPVDLMLIIGPARAVDRDGLTKLLEPIRTGRGELRAEMRKPLIVVATQTIEAGVDIDFDGLVTEAAAFDALRQRFGRLNRAGRAIKARALILAHKDDIGAKADDPVYGDRIKETWKALQDWADESKQVDFGIQAMDATITERAVKLDGLVSAKVDAPVLMPAYAHLWSQTSPIPKADPDIGLFLHGPKRSQASVQIVWRADVDEDDLRAAARDDDERQRLIELFSLLPPRASEAIEVPLWAARAWLKEALSNTPDFSDSVEVEVETDARGARNRPAFRWASKDSDSRTAKKSKDRSDEATIHRSRTVYPDNLRPEDLIVVSASYGGCDKWGWNREWTADVIDLADKAAEPYAKRQLVVRATPNLIAQGLLREGKVAPPGLASKLSEALKSFDAHDRVADVVAMFKEFDLPAAMQSQLDMIENAKGVQIQWLYGLDAEDRPRGIALVAQREAKHDRLAVDETAATAATEDEETGALADSFVTIIAHCGQVRKQAEQFTTRAGLPPEEAGSVSLAAYLHDAGKADARYQAYYAGGDPYGPDKTAPLAKTGGRRLPHGAWEKAGLPDGWRHEALSVRLAEIHPGMASAPDRELVVWLIGTHHGLGRPLFPHADDADNGTRVNLLRAFGCEAALPAGPGPQSLAYDFNGKDWAGLFGALKERYGIWGLARLEAFVRLADHRASEMADASDGAPIVLSAAPTVPRQGRPDHRHRLEGLAPDNVLAFMALLGLLRALEAAHPDWQPRAGWDLDQAPLRPYLALRKEVAREDILKGVADGIRKLAEVNDFGGLAKLKLTRDEARGRLTETLQHTQDAGDDCDRSRASRNAELWAALVSDAAFRKDDFVLRTPFCLLDVAQTSFLKTLAEVCLLDCLPRGDREQQFRDAIEQTLFHGWERKDKTPSFRWDPIEDSRHAYRWAAPTDEKQGVQHGANMLAAVGLPALTVMPVIQRGDVRLGLIGGESAREGMSFAWPIWREPTSLAGVRSLLSHPKLRQAGALHHLGVDQVNVTSRISPPGSKYANFTFARLVQET